MTSEEISTLRKDVKKLMVELDLDKWGAMSGLADQLSARLGRSVSRNNLSMALSGYRQTESYANLLQDLKAMLTDMGKTPDVTIYTAATTGQ